MAENTAFDSLYAHGFARVAAVTLPVAIADPVTNASRIVAAARQAHARGVAVAVFPELALTGYAIDDLLLQDALLETVHAQIRRIAADSEGLTPVLVFGAPIRHRNRLFNCAVVVKDGEVLGVAPKTYLPNYREFYEKRHFASGVGLEGEYLTLPGLRRAQQDQASAGPDGFEDDFEDELADEIEVPFGPDLIFRATDLPDLALHVEICEDMWVPVPPSARASLAGATLLVNLSGSPITIGRAEDRRQLVASASARCLAGYVYAAAGQGESTTDLAWDGQTMIYELGTLLAEGERFAAPHGERPTLTVADVDLGRITQERLRQGSFDDNARALEIGDGEFTEISFELEPPTDDLGLLRKVDRFPFVPDDPARLAQDCYEAYHIQVAGLEQRLRAIGTPKAVIGVSGGLDSTHALIVACKAMDRLGRPRSDVLAFTMPGFATGETSKGYATRLSQLLGVTFAELDIRPTATQMLKDMGHPFGDGEPVYDVTFENVQAGLRYDYLFRLANQRGGIVVGTGDLSELALGWCTYGVGDQMSHYGVNAGVPKTLVQHLIRWVADHGELDADPEAEVNGLLREILAQEITPELIPDTEGVKPQATQDTVGPYNLQDFTLFHLVRHGVRPQKIAFLASHAWRDAAAGEWPPGFPTESRVAYSRAEIKHWLGVFIKRFFANQFKRSALPNGPKVSSGGTMSPRGDWRMPSDARPDAWLADLAAVPEE